MIKFSWDEDLHSAFKMEDSCLKHLKLQQAFAVKTKPALQDRVL